MGGGVLPAKQRLTKFISSVSRFLAAGLGVGFINVLGTLMEIQWTRRERIRLSIVAGCSRWVPS